jgi:hypothetical protein
MTHRGYGRRVWRWDPELGIPEQPLLGPLMGIATFLARVKGTVCGEKQIFSEEVKLACLGSNP